MPSIAIVTTTTEITLDTTLDSVVVKACCAPMTSEFRREMSAPVWVRIKNARGIR